MQVAGIGQRGGHAGQFQLHTAKARNRAQRRFPIGGELTSLAGRSDSPAHDRSVVEPGCPSGMDGGQPQCSAGVTLTYEMPCWRGCCLRPSSRLWLSFRSQFAPMKLKREVKPRIIRAKCSMAILKTPCQPRIPHTRDQPALSPLLLQIIAPHWRTIVSWGASASVPAFPPSMGAVDAKIAYPPPLGDKMPFFDLLKIANIKYFNNLQDRPSNHSVTPHYTKTYLNGPKSATFCLFSG